MLPAVSEVSRRLTWVVGAVAWGLACLGVFTAGARGFDVPIRIDAQPPRSVTRGLGDVVAADDGTLVQRTESLARFRLPDLDRHAAWRVHLRVRAPRSAGAPAPMLAVGVDDRVVTQATITPQWQWLDIDLPSRAGRGLVLELDTTRGPDDAAPPGVELAAVRFEALTFAWPSQSALVAVLASAAGFGFLAAVVGGLFVPALAFTALVAHAWLLTHGYGGLREYASWSGTWAIGTCVAGLTVSLALARARVDRAWGASIAVSTVVLAVQGWILSHPSMGLWDSVFHLHRFSDVRAGQYFFTSSGPGGSLPYPIALYVVASPFARVVDPVWLLRAMCAVAHAAAGIAVFAATKRWTTAPRGLWAQLFFFAAPAGFHVQAVAYLTNSFGQSLAVVALCALGLWLSDRRRAVLGLFALAAAGAFLAHVSSMAILASTIGVVVAAAWFRKSTRAAAVIVAGVAAMLMVGVALAYYVHFPETYAALLRPRPVTAGAGAIPVMRVEAHQTEFAPGLAALQVRLAAVPGYALRYFSWWLPLLAVLSLVGRRAIRERGVSVVLVSWLVVCGGFFVLGQLTRVDLRYYLAVYPALAMTAALVAPDGRPKTAFEWITGAIGVAAIVTGAAYWFSWL